MRTGHSFLNVFNLPLSSRQPQSFKKKKIFKEEEERKTPREKNLFGRYLTKVKIK